MSKTYKDKLISFEVQPPPAAWSHIAEELHGNKELFTISNKLFDYEVNPPIDAWNAITASLKDGKTLHNPSLIKQKSRLLSYSMAAAAILAAVMIGFIYLNNKDVFSNKLAIRPAFDTKFKDTLSEEPVARPLPLISKQDAEEIMEAPPATILKTNKNNTKNNKVLQNTIVKKLLFPGNELQIAIAAKPIRNANGVIIQNPEIINPGSKYISITGPNGQQTKISSKFLHMLLFINDDSDIDEVDGYFDKNFLESLIWKSRFQDWRNKLINTSFVPSSTNFMDILDFKDLIMNDK